MTRIMRLTEHLQPFQSLAVRFLVGKAWRSAAYEGVRRMTNTDRTVWKWMPFAPIALGIVVTAWVALANHNSTAYYDEAWIPGAVAAESAGPDAMPIQLSRLRK
jgi:hypothetical protein